MGYTGDVEIGGPSDVRELAEVVIRKASVSAMDNNAYLLTCRATGDQLLIDAADDAERLLALVREGSSSARLNLIVTTHRHPDHHRALASLVAVTGAPVAAGAADADALEVPVTRRLRHGDRIKVGDLQLDVIGLRGHTDGSVALAYTEPQDVRAPGAVPGRTHLFSGDSLFPGGVGSTDRDPDRFARLYTDVVERIFEVYRDDTWVYPGHGRDTTLGAERPHLTEWRERGW